MDRTRCARNRRSALVSVQKLILLGFCLAFLLIGPGDTAAGARAETGIPYPPELMTRYGDLTEEQKSLFPGIYEGVRRNDDAIALPRGTRYEDAKAVMTCILEDCPELCNLSGLYTVDYYRLGPDEATRIRPEYISGPESVDRLLQKASEICAAVSGEPLAREEQLYDLLIGRCSYEETPNAFNAYGAILEGKAVCEGYARAYALLLRLSGIRCGTVTGYADNGSGEERHAWNIVGIGEYTLFCDPTWDDPVNGQFGNLHFYFNVPELPDHRPGDPVRSVSLTDALTWHATHGTLIAPSAGREITTQVILEQITMNGCANIRFGDEEGYRDLRENTDEIVRSVFDRMKGTGSASCIYSFNDGQRCAWIRIVTE